MSIHYRSSVFHLLCIAGMLSPCFLRGPLATAVEQKRNAAKKNEQAAAKDIPVFETDVLPIFKARCIACHKAQSRKADLDLTS